MTESSDEAAIVKRANWVGLRTIRQRPKVVDHTNTGQPVFEARSVRLILREDGAHFARLVSCSRCSLEVTGSSVRSPADLDRPTHSVICKDCVRAASLPTDQHPSRRPSEPETQITADPQAAPRRAELGDDGRLERVEAQLQAVGYRLTHLADAQAQEATTRSRAVEEIAAQVVTLLGAVQDLRAEGAAQVEAIAVRLADIEAKVDADQDDHVVERRLEEMVQEVGPIADAAAAERTVRLEQLQAALAEQREQWAADVAQLRQENEQVRRSQSEELQHLRQALDDQRALARWDLAARERLDGELIRVKEQIDERIQGLAGWLAHTAQQVADASAAHEQTRQLQAAIDAGVARAATDVARLEQADSLQMRTTKELHERLDRLEEVSTRLAESQSEGMEELRQELAEIRTAILSLGADNADRLDTLEKALETRDTEVSDLFDFHAVLDTGMGELRSELARLRPATRPPSDAQADIRDRLDELAGASRSSSPPRRRREARRTDAATETAAARAIEELARQQQQFDAELARLEETAAGATVAISAQASSHASALGSIRSDIEALHEHLTAQEEVIASLRKSVEGVRRKMPEPAPPAAKRTPRPKT